MNNKMPDYPTDITYTINITGFMVFVHTGYPAQ